MHEKYEKKGLVILYIGIDPKENDELARKWIAKRKVTFIVLRDRKAEVAKKYRVWQRLLPITYIVDSKGVIQDVHEGVAKTSFWEVRLKPWLK